MKLSKEEKKKWNYMLASVSQSDKHNCSKREFYDDITEWLNKYRSLMEEKKLILDKYF